MGVEPTNGGTTILCLNRLATLAIVGITIALTLADCNYLGKKNELLCVP